MAPGGWRPITRNGSPRSSRFAAAENPRTRSSSKECRSGCFMAPKTRRSRFNVRWKWWTPSRQRAAPPFDLLHWKTSATIAGKRLTPHPRSISGSKNNPFRKTAGGPNRINFQHPTPNPTLRLVRRWLFHVFLRLVAAPARCEQGEFKNRRKSRSRQGYEAEVFFVPKSASLRRRLPFLNSPSSTCKGRNGRICPRWSQTHSPKGRSARRRFNKSLSLKQRIIFQYNGMWLAMRSACVGVVLSPPWSWPHSFECRPRRSRWWRYLSSSARV